MQFVDFSRVGLRFVSDVCERGVGILVCKDDFSWLECRIRG